MERTIKLHLKINSEAYQNLQRLCSKLKTTQSEIIELLVFRSIPAVSCEYLQRRFFTINCARFGDVNLEDCVNCEYFEDREQYYKQYGLIVR